MSLTLWQVTAELFLLYSRQLPCGQVKVHLPTTKQAIFKLARTVCSKRRLAIVFTQANGCQNSR